MRYACLLGGVIVLAVCPGVAGCGGEDDDCCDAARDTDASAIPADAASPDAEAAAVDAALPDAGVADAAPPECPLDMVYVPTASVCVDRYEASEGVASVAMSVPGAVPWVSVTRSAAEVACEAAGKRLCEHAEWIAACTGPPPGTTYPYGDTFDADACNGYNHGVHAAVPTGSMATCEGGFGGIFDITGNVWEWTGTTSDGMIEYFRGGAFDVFSDGFVRCDAWKGTDPGAVDVRIGFRCCLSP